MDIRKPGPVNSQSLRHENHPRGSVSASYPSPPSWAGRRSGASAPAPLRGARALDRLHSIAWMNKLPQHVEAASAPSALSPAAAASRLGGGNNLCRSDSHACHMGGQRMPKTVAVSIGLPWRTHGAAPATVLTHLSRAAGCTSTTRRLAKSSPSLLAAPGCAPPLACAGRLDSALSDSPAPGPPSLGIAGSLLEGAGAQSEFLSTCCACRALLLSLTN